MKKWLKWALILLVIGIVAGSIGWWYTFHKPALNAFDVKPELETTAAKIVTDFSADEQAAYKTYTNEANTKVIAFTGKVVAVDANDTSATLTLEDEMSGISCTFNGDYFLKQKEKITALQSGNEVKIKGKCNGYLMDVKFDNCVIIDK